MLQWKSICSWKCCDSFTVCFLFSQHLLYSVEYEDGHTFQQSLQRFLVCDTLIIVSFVFLGSRCSYNFKELLQYYFVLLTLNLINFQASGNLLGSNGMLGV